MHDILRPPGRSCLVLASVPLASGHSTSKVPAEIEKSQPGRAGYFVPATHSRRTVLWNCQLHNGYAGYNISSLFEAHEADALCSATEYGDRREGDADYLALL